MLFLDGVYLDRSDGTRFRWVKAPTNQDLTQLAHTIAHRVVRFDAHHPWRASFGRMVFTLQTLSACDNAVQKTR